MSTLINDPRFPTPFKTGRRHEGPAPSSSAVVTDIDEKRAANVKLAMAQRAARTAPRPPAKPTRRRPVSRRKTHKAPTSAHGIATRTDIEAARRAGVLLKDR